MRSWTMSFLLRGSFACALCLPLAPAFAVPAPEPRLDPATQPDPALRRQWLQLRAEAADPLTAPQLARLQALLATHGWPTRPAADAELINIAGELLLRASSDYDYQQQVIDLVLSRTGVDVDTLAAAALNDAIEIRGKQRQQFGTFFKLEGGKVVASTPVVGHRYQRDLQGMPPLADYIAQLQAHVDAGQSLATAQVPPPLAQPAYHPYQQSALRRELGEMIERDQQARAAFLATLHAGKPDPALEAAISQVDAANLARVREILDEVGFPTPEMVGRDGVSTYFLLVQHADDDPALQQRALDLAKPLMEQRRMSRQQYAMLTDRVRLAQGHEQLYGTQARLKDGKVALEPVEDAAHLDERRANMAMGTSAEYLGLLQAQQAPR